MCGIVTNMPSITTEASKPTGAASTETASDRVSPPSLPIQPTPASTSSSTNGQPPPPTSSTTTTTTTSDDLGGSSDEVKVFNAEGEEGEEANGSGLGEDNLQDGLQEEKTSLISEQEKAIDARHGFAAGLHALGMSPYFAAFPSYAAAYAASNRSHFLYGAGDPLVGSPPPPPPAHMGVYLEKSGLRPSLYPFPHPQYPYSMLSPDHLAAWHQQQMYQAGAAAAAGLRPGSPYSLPITSTSLSPMSRFSPSLLSHPGFATMAANSAAAAAHAASLNAAGGGHVKQEYESGRSHHSGKESPCSKQKKEPHIKKPLNAFMLYMKEMRPRVQAECTLKESAAINQILGRRWHGLTREEQAKYYEKARVERQKHMQMYPHWNARDNYRFGLEKKKRKREKNDDPGTASMKKCRARYGLDQQELWCKPCRRKKKCIRVQAYIDSKNNPNNNNKNNKDINDTNGHNNNNINMFSDGEDEDEDDDDLNLNGHSPAESSNLNMNNGHGSNNSEQSLTSPAGFSSLPSLGSPSGSIASPSTPSSSSAVNLNTNNGSNNSNNGNGLTPLNKVESSSSSLDWLRALHQQQLSTSSSSQGAFYRPFGTTQQQQQQQQHNPPSLIPPPTSSFSPFPSSSYSFHHLHHQQLQQQQQIQQNLQHLPHLSHVGTDPRDSKHPLGVTQLTGNFCGNSTNVSNGVSASGRPLALDGEKRTKFDPILLL